MPVIRIYLDTREVTISIQPKKMQVNDPDYIDTWNFFDSHLLMRLTDDQARDLYSALRAFYSDDPGELPL